MEGRCIFIWSNLHVFQSAQAYLELCGYIVTRIFDYQSCLERGENGSSQLETPKTRSGVVWLERWYSVMY